MSSVLKQYLRRLPLPLITFGLYDAFVRTVDIADEFARIRIVQDILEELPPVHFASVKTLFVHLQNVTRHADQNLMSPRNLAVVLGPTVIWDETGDREMLDMHRKTQSIQFLIEHADEMFL